MKVYNVISSFDSNLNALYQKTTHKNISWENEDVVDLTEE